MNKITIILLFCTAFIRANAQDTAMARLYIDSLCAPYMHGRGIAMNGASKAASFIATIFEKLGVQPINHSFMQPFSHVASVFPSSFSISYEGKTLRPGYDFGCNPFTGHLSGHFKLFRLDGTASKSEWMQEILQATGKIKKMALVIRTNQMDAVKLLANKKLNPSAVIILQENKITHGLEGEPGKYPMIPMLNTALPKEIKTINIDIEGVMLKHGSFQNVIGYVKGIEVPDSFIVFTAHYDHLGLLGSGHYFPGANDNASGTAMLLSLAAYYAQHPSRYSVAFIAFDGEERGLFGSAYYIRHPLFPVKQIRFLVNMDILGTGDTGIGLVNARVFTDDFAIFNGINEEAHYVVKIKKRGKAAISDHYWFTEAGIHSFYIYTMGGIAAYHDFNDRPETLPLTDFSDVFRLLVAFTNKLTHSESLH